MTMLRRLLLGLCAGVGILAASPTLAKPIVFIGKPVLVASGEEKEKPAEPAVPLPVDAMIALQKAWAQLKPTIPAATTNKEIGEFFEIVMTKVIGTTNPVFIFPDGTQVRYLGVGEDHQRVLALFVAVNRDVEPKQIVAVIWEGQNT